MPPQAITRKAINPNRIRVRLRFFGTAFGAACCPAAGTSPTFFKATVLMSGRSPKIYSTCINYSVWNIYVNWNNSQTVLWDERGGSNGGAETAEDGKRISAGGGDPGADHSRGPGTVRRTRLRRRLHPGYRSSGRRSRAVVAVLFR